MRSLILFAFAIGCEGTVDENPNADTSDEDLEGPVIDTIPLADAQISGTDITVTANITDLLGEVQDARLYFKRETSVTWETAPMIQAGESSAEFNGIIPGDSVAGAGGMHYYIWASDDRQNETFKPEDGEDDPYHFSIVPAEP